MDSRLLCFALVVALVNAENKDVNLGSDTASFCGKNVEVNFEDTISFSVPGKVSSSVNSCSVRVVAAGAKPNDCEYRQICIAPSEPLTYQCLVGINVQWRDQDLSSVASVDLSHCVKKEFEAEYCSYGESMEIEVFKKAGLYKAYKFDAVIKNKCSKTATSKSLQPLKTKPQGDVEEPDWEKMAAQVHQNRVLGIITGVCLAVIFLIILVVTYIYYKNKPYRQVPK